MEENILEAALPGTRLGNVPRGPRYVEVDHLATATFTVILVRAVSKLLGQHDCGIARAAAGYQGPKRLRKIPPPGKDIMV